MQENKGPLKVALMHVYPLIVEVKQKKVLYPQTFYLATCAYQ